MVPPVVLKVVDAPGQTMAGLATADVAAADGPFTVTVTGVLAPLVQYGAFHEINNCPFPAL